MEWTHGIGLFGLYRYHELTGSSRARQIIDDWFSARFAEGTPEKNINTAIPFLTLANRYQQDARHEWRAYLEVWEMRFIVRFRALMKAACSMSPTKTRIISKSGMTP
ncbi:Rhamnogalacturonides degradation protein RhiN [Klebsiella michiganensis]|uniref:Rhamnogalacturonides degradation protein RhiN n=1 Tax=Klebsiella michiganensis TaxID=1134687 RepID=A0A7H4MU41_9ENTR|nr:Rhamnogalacturonides degradation protein RhiN [Klebsiella michiganensis]